MHVTLDIRGATDLPLHTLPRDHLPSIQPSFCSNRKPLELVSLANEEINMPQAQPRRTPSLPVRQLTPTHHYEYQPPTPDWYLSAQNPTDPEKKSRLMTFAICEYLNLWQIITIPKPNRPSPIQPSKASLSTYAMLHLTHCNIRVIEHLPTSLTFSLRDSYE